MEEVWAHLGFTSSYPRCSPDRLSSVTMEILSKLSGETEGLPTEELVSIATWYLWWQQRQMMKGSNVQTPEKTDMPIRVVATNFIRSMTHKLADRTMDQIWKKLGENLVKVNVDASFHGEELSRSCGAVVRDGQLYSGCYLVFTACARYGLG